MVSIDLSLFAEIVIFLLLMVTLDRIMYRPVLARINERKKRLEEEKSTLNTIQSDETVLKTNIQTKLLSAHQTAEQHHTDVIREVKTANARRSESLSREFNEKIQTYTRTAEENTRSTRKEIEQQIEPLARQFINKLLPVFLCIFLIGFPIFGAIAASSSHDAGSHETAHEGGHEEEHAGISETWRAINFIVMITILFFIARKPVVRALQGRTETIAATLNDSTLAIASAKGSLSVLETRFTEVETEASEIVRESAAQTETIQKQIDEAGKLKLEKIESVGNKQLEMISQKTFESLNSETVSKALDKASEILSRGIDPETDRKLVSDCIEKLDIQIQKSREN